MHVVLTDLGVPKSAVLNARRAKTCAGVSGPSSTHETPSSTAHYQQGCTLSFVQILLNGPEIASAALKGPVDQSNMPIVSLQDDHERKKQSETLCLQFGRCSAAIAQASV